MAPYEEISPTKLIQMREQKLKNKSELIMKTLPKIRRKDLSPDDVTSIKKSLYRDIFEDRHANGKDSAKDLSPRSMIDPISNQHVSPDNNPNVY